MQEPVYMISDKGAVKSWDGMLAKYRSQFISIHEAMGFRVCTKEEYDDWRKRLKEEPCKDES